MSAPISTATASHYDWGDGCDGWHLVRAPGLSVIQERMPPNTAEARHRHAVARQCFFVLDGALTIEVDGVTHALGTHDALEIAPGCAHQVFNRSARDVSFLVVSQPPSHGDREPAA